MTDTREIVFWTTTEFEEQLTHRSRHDAVTQWLDDNPQIKPRQMPSAIKVYGWARMEIDKGMRAALADIALEDVIDRIEEEYGDPDGDVVPDKTDKMREAAATFVEAVLKSYTVWACEQVVEEDFIVRCSDCGQIFTDHNVADCAEARS
jgi:hypothetical protein